MSETTPPVNPPAAAEPQNPAEASAQKKQTVRISLPPKPAGGPSIRVPVAAASAPAPVSAPASPAVPAPAATVAAAPAAKPASISGLDMGLAFAAMVLGIAAVAVQFFVAN